MKNFIEEFKTFINKGNVMDLAVGVIIGGAFQSIINSLVNDIVMPILSIFTGGLDFSSYSIAIGSQEGAATINYGSFISTIIDFILMALVVFIMIKNLNKMKEKMEKKEEVKEEIKTKICPYCKSEIAIDATRCPHCTSEV